MWYIKSAIQKSTAKQGKYIYDYVKGKIKALNVLDLKKTYKISHDTIRKELRFMYNQNWHNKLVSMTKDEKMFLKKIYRVIDKEQSKDTKLTKSKLKLLYLFVFYIYYTTR